MNQRCLAAQPDAASGWHCMFGAGTAKYVSVPLFVLNSKYDTWQEKAIIGVNCTIEQCNATQQAFWADYGRAMVAAADALPAQHGAFLHNCPAHCETGIGMWRHVTVGGVA